MVGKLAVLVLGVVGLIAALAGCTNSPSSISWEDCLSVYDVLDAPRYYDARDFLPLGDTTWVLSERCKVAIEDEVLRQINEEIIELQY